MGRHIGAVAVWVLMAAAAGAAEPAPLLSGASWRIESGTTRLHLREWVFMQMAPWNVSRLDWTVTAPTLAADLDVPLAGGASFGLGVETLLRQDGYMTDKD